MQKTFWLMFVSGAAAALAMAQGPSFDKLAKADRDRLGERFKQEVWPLLLRGGKDGCVGCHNRKTVPAPRFAGDADQDFRMLLREGFLLKDDPGSLLARIREPNRKRRMPPGNRPAWTAAEIKVLSDFVDAVHGANRRPQEPRTK